jgi:hypothetical protein
MTFPASRQAGVFSTATSATSPVSPITQAGGSGWVPDTRSHSTAITCTTGLLL